MWERAHIVARPCRDNYAGSERAICIDRAGRVKSAALSYVGRPAVHSLVRCSIVVYCIKYSVQLVIR